MRAKKQIIKKGEWDRILNLLQNPQSREAIFKGLDPNAYREEDGCNLLMAAVDFNALKDAGNLDYIKFLLDNKADPNQTDRYGCPALIYAISSECVLLESKSHQNHNWELTRLLVEHKADVNYLPSGNPKFRDTKQDDITPRNLTALAIVCECHNASSAVDFLLASKADPNLKGKYLKLAPLHKASRIGSLKIVESLLKAKADANAITKDGFTSLLLLALACKEHYQDSVEKILALLINFGADINRLGDGRTALAIAARHNNLLLSRSLLNHKADPNILLKINYQVSPGVTLEGQSTVLHLAVEHSGKKVIESLLEYKASPLTKNSRHINALQNALFNGLVDIVKLFIKSGADLAARKKLWSLALYSAVEYQKTGMVVWLLSHPDRSDINAQHEGLSALHQAVNQGNRTITGLLVDSKADANVQGMEGITPIFAAARAGHSQCVRYLLSNNADPDILTTNKVSPLYMAYSNGQANVVQLLMDKHYRKVHRYIPAQKFDVLLEIMLTICTLKPDEKDELQKSAATAWVDTFILSLSILVPHVKQVYSMLDQLSQPIHDHFSDLDKETNDFIEQTPPKLEQLGYTTEKRRALREKTKKGLEQEEKKNEDDADLKTISWFGGLMTSDLPEVVAVEPLHLNNYFYLDLEGIAQQGCSASEIEIFSNVRKKLCPTKEGSEGLKLLEEFFQVDIEIEGARRRVTVTHELKIINQFFKSRVFCFQEKSLTGQNLLIACLYDPDGLHDKQTIQKWHTSKKVFKMSLPKLNTTDEKNAQPYSSMAEQSTFHDSKDYSSASSPAFWKRSDNQAKSLQLVANLILISGLNLDEKDLTLFVDHHSKQICVSCPPQKISDLNHFLLEKCLNVKVINGPTRPIITLNHTLDHQFCKKLTSIIGATAKSILEKYDRHSPFI